MLLTHSLALKLMACTKEYIDFVCSQLQGVGIVRARKMFGDWCLYVDEKAVILACDNQCYVKMHPALDDLMRASSAGDPQTGFPYEGAKPHYLLDIEHREQALPVVKRLVEILPYPKPKKKKQ